MALDSMRTTTTAAAELGVTPGRVRAMIAAGRLKADRAGRDWLIEPKALATVRERKPGRPPVNPRRRRFLAEPTDPQTTKGSWDFCW